MTAKPGLVKQRPTGATARLGRNGRAQVTTVTGGAMEIVTAASEPGFNPLDLVYASLAACLVLSARIAASTMGLLDRLEEVEAEVAGAKSDTVPARIGQFTIHLRIRGDFDDETRHAIAFAAEEICTVSNTLKGDPGFSITVGA